ncbi:MAG: phosphatase PAP2 family protein [Specibacter sp.]
MTTTSRTGNLPPQLRSGTRRRWQWVTAAGCGAFIVAMMIALLPAPATPFFQGFDTWWHSVATAPAGYRLSGPVAVLDAFGRPPGIVVFLAIMAVLAIARRWRAVLFTLLCFLVPSLLAQVVKNVVDRPRPADPFVIVDHGSFPSGHCVQTAAFVVLIAVLLSPAVRRYWWPVGIAFVLVMMWSRTFVAAHWLSDTFAGTVLGTGAALLLWWLFTPLLARDDARRASRRATRTRRTQTTA